MTDAPTRKALTPVGGELVRTAHRRPAREDALEAVRTLIAWAGDDPARADLQDTPDRVLDAYREWFAGYDSDPHAELGRTFDLHAGYDDLVMLRDIDVESHCEHHLAPFLGRAYVAYQPGERVVGLSKLARVVEAYAKRLQNQEALTAQIAEAIDAALAPRGVAVMVDAVHECMTTRGLRHKAVSTVTTQFTGVFKTDRSLQDRFLAFCNRS